MWSSFPWDAIFNALAGITVLLVLGYKIISGWLVTNMELEVVTERIEATSSSDYLKVALVMKKGPNDSLRLNRIGLRMIPAAQPAVPDEKLANGLPASAAIGNASYWTADTQRLRVDEKGEWLAHADSNAFVLAPGDRTQFGTAFLVDRDKSYRIDAVAEGPAFLRWWSDSQWRASTVVTPGPPEEIIRPTTTRK